MDDASGEDALCETQELMRELRPFFEAVVGPERTEKLLSNIAEGVPAFLDSPKTWAANLEDLTAQGIAETKFGETLESFVHLLPGLVKLGRNLEADRRSRDARLVSDNPAANKLVELIVVVTKDKGAQATLPLLPTADAGAFSPLLGAYSGLGQLLRRGTESPDDVTFEQWAAVLASQVAHASETFYRPMLESALLITLVRRGDQPKAPSLLGATMSRCRALWARSHSELLPLLLDPVRILRNSEAHGHTEIAPRAETITFVNRRSDGTRDVFGPLDSSGFGTLVQDFIRLCMAMDAAFRLAKSKIEGG